MFSLPVVSDYLAILYTIPEFIPDGKMGRQVGGLKGGWGTAGAQVTPPHRCIHSASSLASSRPGVPNDPRDRVLHQPSNGTYRHVLQPLQQPAVHLGQLPSEQVKGWTCSASTASLGWEPILMSPGFQIMPKSRSCQDSSGENTGWDGQG